MVEVDPEIAPQMRLRAIGAEAGDVVRGLDPREKGATDACFESGLTECMGLIA